MAEKQELLACIANICLVNSQVSYYIIQIVIVYPKKDSQIWKHAHENFKLCEIHNGRVI